MYRMLLLIFLLSIFHKFQFLRLYSNAKTTIRLVRKMHNVFNSVNELAHINTCFPLAFIKGNFLAIRMQFFSNFFRLSLFNTVQMIIRFKLHEFL